MTTTASYAVVGMTCGHCELSVREEVVDLPGVQHVTADHATGELVVTSTEPLDRARVATAVEAAGYALGEVG